MQIKEIDLRSKRAPEEARRRVTAEKTAIINQLHEMLQLLYPLEMVQQPEENHADFGYFSNAIYNWCDQLFDFVTFYFNESIHQKKKREKEKLAWSLWSESNFENLAKHQERIEAKKGAAPDVR